VRWLLSAVLLVLSPAAGAAPAFDHEHTLWTTVLKSSVNEGNVAYMDLAGDDKKLSRYLDTLKAVTPAQYNAWTDKQKMAFWINAHNAFAVRFILDRHPLESIRADAVKKPFIPIRALGPDDLSLTDIQNILGTRFTDVRVHFALTAPARSAPALRPSAYRADALDSQLEDAAYAFINDPDRNSVDVDRGVARLNPLFRDHRKEFDSVPRGLPGFLALYVSAENADRMRTTRMKIEYSEMDWALNGR